MATFDLFGWYAGNAFPGRHVDVEPVNLSQTTEPGAPRANWTGHQWVDLPYVPSVPVEDAYAKRVFIEIQTGIQNRLDEFARTRMYDDIKSAADYAGDEDPVFNAEGTYCKQMRSRTWRAGTNLLNDVQNGQRPMPTSYAEIENELPELQWPV